MEEAGENTVMGMRHAREKREMRAENGKQADEFECTCEKGQGSCSTQSYSRPKPFAQEWRKNTAWRITLYL